MTSTTKAMLMLATGLLLPATARAADPFAPVEMTGPLPTLAAFCKLAMVKKSCPKQGENGNAQTVICAPAKDAPQPAHAGFDEARVLVTQCDNPNDPPHADIRDSTVDRAYVALHRADGWWVTRELVSARDGYHDAETLKFEPPVWRDVPPGFVTTFVVEGEIAGGNAQDFVRRWLVFTGAGPSGKPSSTGAILYADKLTWDEEDPAEERRNYNRRFTPAWSADGQLELRPRKGPPRVHRIVLP